MKLRAILGGIIIVLVAVVGVLSYKMVKFSDKAGRVAVDPNRYSVVYLTNGEIYIGKLDTKNNWELSDAYLFTVVKHPTDASKNTFQLTPLKGAWWSPDALYVNPKEVFYYGPISEASAVMKTLAASKK